MRTWRRGWSGKIAGWIVATLWLFALGPAEFALSARGQAIDEEEPDEPLAGVVVRFERPEGEPVRQVALRVAATGRWSTIDRRLPDDPQVRAIFTGRLKTATPGAYRLLFHVRGQLRVRLDGQAIIDETQEQSGWAISRPLDMPFGYHPLEVEYTGNEKGALLAMFWSGPDFGLEPVGPRFLDHEFDRAVDRDLYARGEALVRGGRCVACHAIRHESPLAAPALDRLTGMVRAEWLVEHAASDGATSDGATRDEARRMPYFALPLEEAQAIRAFLLSSKHTPPPFRPEEFDSPNAEPGAKPGAKPETAPPASAPKKPADKNAKSAKRVGPDRAAGERLAWTLGCVACHQLDDSHRATPFDGGDLRRVAAKRTPEFFEPWLADPSSRNVDRRMPEFTLGREEREDLAAYLAQLGAKASDEAAAAKTGGEFDAELAQRGRELFVSRKCVACHRGPGGLAAQPTGRAGALKSDSNWNASCLGAPDPRKARPGYRWSESDVAAAQAFIASIAASPGAKGKRFLPVDQLLVERGCVACHSRDDRQGIASRLAAVAQRNSELAPLIPAMTPPSLTSVGDKLHDPALAGSITRLGGVHRPYLLVRMPRFRLAPEELDTLIAGLAAADRVPEGVPTEVLPQRNGISASDLPESLIRSAGARLVTQDGFGCTSCHAVGKVEPPPGPLAARGPNLSKLETRIRRSWYDRWVRNPVRIVPRMEMPSVQLAVRGVLADRLDHQLDAVWRVLNLPDFEPPEPNPIQTLRRSGLAELREPAAVATDVLRVGATTYVKPFLAGLPNRHSLLFDLESNRLIRWSVGDVARQRTKGKSWYWEVAGTELLRPSIGGSELWLERDGAKLEPQRTGQFLVELDRWEHLDDGGLACDYRLRFSLDNADRIVRVTQTWRPVYAGATGTSGWSRRVAVSGAPQGWRVALRAVGAVEWSEGKLSEDRRAWSAAGSADRAVIRARSDEFRPDGTLVAHVATDPAVDAPESIELQYETNAVVDQFPPVTAPKPVAVRSQALDVVPGFVVERLPLPLDQMPTALAWRGSGELVVASLKGRVWTARDSDGDGELDAWKGLSDELAAPYGLAAHDDYVDVTTKFGVVRLHDANHDGWAERSEVIASGWGHTDDYHDWTIGLPSDERGNYYVGLACQQDKRTPEAARLRGTVLRLTPRTPTIDNPRRFELELLSGGHRFPMGLARNRDGALFVTDNQGNYNPFNELNHVRPGVRFGFINALEQRPDFKPPAEEPAINIPHPWTRSVNGIVFLETPAKLRAKGIESLYGPFEGHLIGCEYDTRRLVRMSVQRVGDTYQGAAYPLSAPGMTPEQELLGPICVGVAPQGDVYVGGIRDSGWGGGNNIGEIARLRFDPDRLPAGIAEIRTQDGKLTIEFTRAVDGAKVGDPSNYAIESYRRESTPAYGGPDRERRTETVRSVEVDPSRRRVTLDVGPLRAGHVYELRTRSLVEAGTFFPAEAYLTVR